jgi:hypothetical protein
MPKTSRTSTVVSGWLGMALAPVTLFLEGEVIAMSG